MDTYVPYPESHADFGYKTSTQENYEDYYFYWKPIEKYLSGEDWSYYGKDSYYSYWMM